MIVVAFNKKITTCITTNEVESHQNSVGDACKELILDNGNLEEDIQNGKAKNDNNKSIKSWASLFNNKNANKYNADDKNDNIHLLNNTNGNLDIKPLPYYENNAKYDDPNYYRMGGMARINLNPYY